MHQVRVHLNQHEGVLWWAEDDSGFTGGAERLAELVGFIEEWADLEGFIDELEIRLVPSEDEAHLPLPMPQFEVSAEDDPLATHGIDTVRVERVLA